MAEACEAAPFRVHLGADAWTLLAEAVPGAPLPHPFRVHDGPVLDAPARAATRQALRDAALLAGDSGDVLADAGASLRAVMLALAQPSVVIDASVGLGDMLRLAHHAIRGDVAASLARSQRPAGDDELELGPIELGALHAGAVVGEVLRAFGSLEGHPDRTPVALDADVSAVVAQALTDDRADVARAAIERHALPVALATGLRSVARVDVASARGRRSVMAVRVAGGWYLLADATTLRPAGRVELAAAIAASALEG